MDAALRLYVTMTALLADRAERLGDDRGQGTIEYVGMIVVAALIVVAVINTNMGAAIGSRFTDAVNSVLNN